MINENNENYDLFGDDEIEMAEQILLTGVGFDDEEEEEEEIIYNEYNILADSDYSNEEKMEAARSLINKAVADNYYVGAGSDWLYWSFDNGQTITTIPIDALAELFITSPKHVMQFKAGYEEYLVRKAQNGVCRE